MNKGFILDVRGKILDLRERTGIMGILNITPDSFSDGGKYILPVKAVERGIQIAEEGADIIDLGAESTRPGSEAISSQEEIDRILPVIEELLNNVSIPLSVDTYKSEVAEYALKTGVHMINDISALRFNPEMVNVLKKYNVPCVLMHIKGTPKNMQDNPEYKDIIGEIKAYFEERIEFVSEKRISLKNIIIDPGLGFGKKLQDNFLLLKKLNDFKAFKLPILIGPSRKRFIGDKLNLPPDQRFEGTAAAVTAGILNGANIVRVHDVKKTVRVIKIADEIFHSN